MSAANVAAYLHWGDLEQQLNALQVALSVNDVSVVRLMMPRLVSGYAPNGEIVDRVYMEQEAEAAALGLGN